MSPESQTLVIQILPIVTPSGETVNHVILPRPVSRPICGQFRVPGWLSDSFSYLLLRMEGGDVTRGLRDIQGSLRDAVDYYIFLPRILPNGEKDYIFQHDPAFILVMDMVII